MEIKGVRTAPEKASRQCQVHSAWAVRMRAADTQCAAGNEATTVTDSPLAKLKIQVNATEQMEGFRKAGVPTVNKSEQAGMLRERNRCNHQVHVCKVCLNLQQHREAENRLCIQPMVSG